MAATLKPVITQTWASRLAKSHQKRIYRKNIVDDGFFSHMARHAEFDGMFEIPVIHGPKTLDIPENMIPFTKMNLSTEKNECVVFFEMDPMFADVLVAADDYIEDLRQFPFVLSPDCSLYRDMPLSLQIANVYLNRLVGHYFEEKGLCVIPTVRWGDERSYTTELFPERFAFAGVSKKSIVAIGTYGCIQGYANQRYFKEGLGEMLKALEPKVVLVYGSMPDEVFAFYLHRAKFVHYSDWITQRINHG